MFYFLLSSLLSYKVLLIIAAVVPALFLMVKVYRSDRLEPEDPAFLWVLIRSGILAALIALDGGVRVSMAAETSSAEESSCAGADSGSLSASSPFKKTISVILPAPS